MDYDRYITGGRYRSERLLAYCAECDETTAVTAETEYGMTTWDKEECRHCGAEFTEDTATELDEGPEPDYDPTFDRDWR